MQKNQIIIYEGGNGQPRIQVRIENETVWLTQAKLAELFGVTPQNITIHLKNIFAEKEVDEIQTCKDSLQVQKEGNHNVNRTVKMYNLDVVISLGYRINSEIATHFRQWATTRLKEYIVKGFVMDDDRLKEMAGGGYWKELLALGQIVSGYLDFAERQAELETRRTQYEYYRNKLLTFQELT